MAVLVEDIENVIDRLDDIAAADAQRLIRWLDRELVAAVAVPLLVVVQSLEPVDERRVATSRACRSVVFAATFVLPRDRLRSMMLPLYGSGTVLIFLVRGARP